MSIVNNRNGVRISFNAALLEKLGVTEKDDTLDVLGIESLRVVLVAKRLPQDAAVHCTLRPVKGSKARVTYAGNLVKHLTEKMNINYEDGNVSSRSFADIRFNDIPVEDESGNQIMVPAAAVVIDDASAGTLPPTAAPGKASA